MPPASHRKALQRLAALAGVKSSYRDAWGQNKQVNSATQRALLSALGFVVSNPREIQNSLLELEEKPWRRLLPPVVIVHDGEAEPHCDLVLAADELSQPLRWVLHLENGERYQGELMPSTLARIDSHVLEGMEQQRLALPLPRELPWGYHQLTVSGEHIGSTPHTTVIVAPTCGYIPDALHTGKGLWGLALQLYGLRSTRNWGMGDFADLRLLAEKAGGYGAAAITLNPLHTLFPDNPEHISPYAPSSREFLNTGYIALEESAADTGLLASLRKSPLVDYARVLPAKCHALEHQILFTEQRAYEDFLRERGESLQQLAVFQALSEHFGRESPWRDWPAEYQHPGSRAVADFAHQHRERIDFFKRLQWLADHQLGQAAAACRTSGMALGLCRDMAVGTDRWGAETWSHPSLFATNASVGAPPDEFNQLGQNWGIPPANPLKLRELAFAPFIALLRANMRHAGALRIDHILGWLRSYWVPEGSPADQGGYVSYPFEELTAIAALESHRNRCLLIGEDLGTVPRGLRAKLDRAGVLSTRVLYFERDEEAMKPPEQYPHLAIASVNTHDLPTLPGFLTGHDLQLRTRLDLFPSPARKQQAFRDRARERRQLVQALQQESLLPHGHLSGHWLRQHSAEVAVAAYRFLARSRAGLVMVNVDDLFDVVEQINLPGTIDQHPNWRRKLPADIDALLADPRFRTLIKHLNRERPGPGIANRTEGES